MGPHEHLRRRRTSGALIYVQTSLHKDEQTLDENINANLDLWRKSEPKKITPIDSVSRGADRSSRLVPASYVALTVEGGPSCEACRHTAWGCSAF